MALDAMELLGGDALMTSDDAAIATYTAPCPIVGVGASASGLAAFQNFLSAAPVDADLADVMAQHDDPHTSSLRMA